MSLGRRPVRNLSIGVIVAGCLAWLLGGTLPVDGPVERTSVDDRPRSEALGSALAPDRGTETRTPAPRTWALVDALTGARLDTADLVLRSGPLVRPLDAPFLTERERARPEARLEFPRNPLPGAEVLSLPCDGLTRRGEADAPALAVPHDAGVRGVVLDVRRGVPLEGAWVDAWLLAPATWRATLDAALPEALEAAAPRGSTQHRLLAYDFLRLCACRDDADVVPDAAVLERVLAGAGGNAAAALAAAADDAFPLPHVRVRTDTTGRYELVLPGSGLVLIRCVRANYEVRFLELHIEPGAFAEATISLRPRPVVRVTLLDEAGRPVPDHRVKVLVRMDPQRFDASELGDDARFAQVAIGAPGALDTVRIRTRTTDSEGRAELVAPRAGRYAAQAVVAGSFAFADSGPVAPDAGVVELVLRVGRGDGDPGRLTVVDDHGRPLADAEVRLGIAGDPWQRQFPSVRLDEQGSVRLTWFPRGARIGGFVRDTEGRPRPLASFTWSGAADATTLVRRDP